MSIPVQTLIRSATRKESDPLRILWLPKDGLFEHLLLPYLPHNFYGGHDVELQLWDTNVFHKPSNFYTLTKHNTFSLDLEFDAVVCNSRIDNKQFENARILSHSLHIPMVLIEHEYPNSVMKKEDIHLCKKEKPADITIACQSTINDRWGTQSQVIPYGFPIFNPTHTPKERVDRLLIIGKFPENDYAILKEIAQKSKTPVEIIGSNPNLSTPIDFNQLIAKLQSSKYYLNISKKFSLIPLLAMSCGCVPLSNDNPLYKTIITKDTGIVFDGLDKLFNILKNTQQDVTELSDNCVKTIEEKFPHQPFIDSYKELFSQFYEYVYTR
jgi:hypothetical protein